MRHFAKAFVDLVTVLFMGLLFGLGVAIVWPIGYVMGTTLLGYVTILFGN